MSDWSEELEQLFATVKANPITDKRFKTGGEARRFLYTKGVDVIINNTSDGKCFAELNGKKYLLVFELSEINGVHWVEV